MVKKSTITETIRLHRLCWFGHIQKMGQNRIPKRVLYMNLESSTTRGGARNRWRDEVREGERRVVGEEWQVKVYNRGMREAAENGKESSYCHGNLM
jgi:hypothetical protein